MKRLTKYASSEGIMTGARKFSRVNVSTMIPALSNDPIQSDDWESPAACPASGIVYGFDLLHCSFAMRQAI